MAVKADDLKAFVAELGKERISLDDLKLEIVRKWGASDYIVNQRIKYMSMLGLIKPDPNNMNVMVIRGLK